MAEVRLLGSFEDGVHRDFVSALVAATLRTAGLSPTIDARLTRGCHVQVFEEHARLADRYRRSRRRPAQPGPPPAPANVVVRLPLC